jgi:hypothetical protein
VSEAVERFRGPAPCALYRYGAAAYDLSIQELKARRADAGGGGYTAACYAEWRAFARDFLGRVARRNPLVEEALDCAAGD